MVRLLIKSEDEKVGLENSVWDWGHPQVGRENGRANHAFLIIDQEFRGPILFGPCGSKYNVSHPRAPKCLPI